MHLAPQETAGFVGVVPNAMRFLAGYGFYVTVATDRFVSRLLDVEALHLGCPPHPAPTAEQPICAAS
eukprot:616611-Heterocapsa_arctica.AAC.1